MRVGNQPEKLVAMLGNNKNIAVIANAMDYLNDPTERKQRVEQSINEMTGIGLDAEEVDLRIFLHVMLLVYQKIGSLNSN